MRQFQPVEDGGACNVQEVPKAAEESVCVCVHRDRPQGPAGWGTWVQQAAPQWASERCGRRHSQARGWTDGAWCRGGRVQRGSQASGLRSRWAGAAIVEGEPEVWGGGRSGGEHALDFSKSGLFGGIQLEGQARG